MIWCVGREILSSTLTASFVPFASDKLRRVTNFTTLVAAILSVKRTSTTQAKSHRQVLNVGYGYLHLDI